MKHPDTKQEMCEWNPDAGRAAFSNEQGHAPATILVGRGSPNWHLCESCAALPRFARYKKRPLRSGGGA